LKYFYTFTQLICALSEKFIASQAKTLILSAFVYSTTGANWSCSQWRTSGGTLQRYLGNSLQSQFHRYFSQSCLQHSRLRVCSAERIN